MKLFNSKLAAIGLAAFVFASCSDNTSDPTGGSSPAKVDATTLDLTNSGESLLSSVINYKNTTANARKFFGTRAASDANFVTDLNKDEESTIPVQLSNQLNKSVLPHLNQQVWENKPLKARTIAKR